MIPHPSEHSESLGSQRDQYRRRMRSVDALVQMGRRLDAEDDPARLFRQILLSASGPQAAAEVVIERAVGRDHASSYSGDIHSDLTAVVLTIS